MLIEALIDEAPTRERKKPYGRKPKRADNRPLSINENGIGLQPTLPLARANDAQNAPSEQTNRLLHEESGLTNVAQIKQLSPFRYPGGKTWLIPELRKWLKSFREIPEAFVEPFAGGAMAGLTAGAEELTDSVTLSELDSDVASVWQTIFCGSDEETTELCRKITQFEVTLENVQEVLAEEPIPLVERAFRTIIKK